MIHNNLLRIHRVMPFSRANGPGMRSVIWTQGCTLHCPGCFNPETHPPDGGELMTPEELLCRITENAGKIEGITVAGGEPLQQVESLLTFLRLVRENTRFTVVLFSGYETGEIEETGVMPELRGLVDVLILGRYDRNRRVSRGLKGSENKIFTFVTDRYSEKDFENVPEGEVVISETGEVIITGIDPPEIK